MSDDEFKPEIDNDGEEVLFDIEPDWKALWKGMPSYDQENLMPYQTLLVHFRTKQDRRAFAEFIGQRMSDETKFLWYPKAEIATAVDKVYTSTLMLPRYPVYIISKGRWESRLTAKALEAIRVPYHIVIEPQEYNHYAAVIDPNKILVLPFSNLGQGSIPARNWVWEHAIATGAERHWILDDNISGFCRFQDNLKVEVDSGATFCAIEDFTDRYENVVMSGFNYDYFAPRKMGYKIRPLTLNTRVYSGMLLSNKIPHRWRGRYNEDTDLSLRILKDGLCTALFNAFLMYKAPTLTMKGGNSDELYKADGRKIMAESLRDQHPDCVTVEWKWDRWQHQVDYRRFRDNALIPKAGVVVADEANEYGMSLVQATDSKNETWEPARIRTPKPNGGKSGEPAPTVRGPSVLSFLGSRRAEPESLAELPRPVSAEPISPVLETEPEPKGIALAAEATVATAVPEPSTQPETVLDAPGVQEPEQEPIVELQNSTVDLEKTSAALRDDLLSRGHRLLMAGDKFFVSEASRLTQDDRDQIKLHRDALILLAEKIVVPSPVVEQAQSPPPRRTTSLFDEGIKPTAVQFSGPGQSVTSNWIPDTPPSLDGIKDVVVNFATSGLKWTHGDRPVGVTVSTLDGQLTRFLPFAFEGGGNLDEATVKEWAQRELRWKKITNAHTRFDMHMARNWGIDFEEQGCTFSDIHHTAALLDDHRKRFRLDMLAEDFLPGQEIIKRVDESRHSEYHASEVAEREVFTAQLVGRLREVMYPMIDEQELRAVHDLEDRLIPVIVEMEKNGAPIDMELLDRYYAECNKEHDSLMWEITKEVGFAFEHKASGWKRLFEYLKIPPSDSYAEDVLSEIDHPLIAKARLASQYASLNSKIFKAYKEMIGSDGILHYELNQLRNEDGGTVTGRLSAGFIQQVPNHDNHAAVFGEHLFPRRLYIPAAGNTYLAADAAQIQYRIFAHYANNPKIMAMYAADPKASFHRMIESLIRPYKADLVYSHVKNMNFMRIFGGGLIKLAVMMNFISNATGEEIRRAKGQRTDPRLAQAREIDAIYDREIPEVGPLLRKASHLAMTKCGEFCHKSDELHRKFPHRGYVKTVLGRRSRFPNDYKLHKAFCMIDQGSEGDIVKTKLCELHEARKDTGFLMRMTVHDEVTGDAQAEDTLAKVDAILNHQSFPQLKVPILWEAKRGKNWAECK